MVEKPLRLKGQSCPGNPWNPQSRALPGRLGNGKWQGHGKTGVPLLLWANVKEPHVSPLFGREAFGFLLLLWLLASEVFQDHSLALQMALTVLLAQVWDGALQEGPHKGLSPLGSQLLLRDRVVWFTVLLSDTRALIPFLRATIFAELGSHISCLPSVSYTQLPRCKSHTHVLTVTPPHTAARSNADQSCFLEVTLLSIQNPL